MLETRIENLLVTQLFAAFEKIFDSMSPNKVKEQSLAPRSTDDLFHDCTARSGSKKAWANGVSRKMVQLWDDFRVTTHRFRNDFDVCRAARLLLSWLVGGVSIRPSRTDSRKWTDYEVAETTHLRHLESFSRWSS